MTKIRPTWSLVEVLYAAEAMAPSAARPIDNTALALVALTSVKSIAQSNLWSAGYSSGVCWRIVPGLDRVRTQSVLHRTAAGPELVLWSQYDRARRLALKLGHSETTCEHLLEVVLTAGRPKFAAWDQTLGCRPVVDGSSVLAALLDDIAAMLRHKEYPAFPSGRNLGPEHIELASKHLEDAEVLELSRLWIWRDGYQRLNAVT